MTVTAHAQFGPPAEITSVVTVGNDKPAGAEAFCATLTSEAFNGGDVLLTAPFVQKALSRLPPRDIEAVNLAHNPNPRSTLRTSN